MSDNDDDGETVDTGDVVSKEESVDGGSDRVRRRRLLSASNVADAKRRKKEQSKVVRVKVTPKSVMKAKKKVMAVSKDAMKLLRARVERSAVALATALEQTSRLAKESAFASLATATNRVVEAGDGVQEVYVWIEAGLNTSDEGRTVLGRIETADVQRRIVSGDALLQALRVALRWPALDAEAIRAMIPFDGGATYASSVQKRIDLAKLGTERYRSELQIQYDTYGDVHKAMVSAERSLAQVLPMRIVTADEEMMQQFVDEMRKAVEKHDASADTAAAVSSSESSAAVVSVAMTSRPTRLRCYNCNKLGHVAQDCLLGPVCHRCQKPGHIARDCRLAVPTQARGGGARGGVRGGRRGRGGGRGGLSRVEPAMVAVETNVPVASSSVPKKSSKDVMFEYIEEHVVVYSIENLSTGGAQPLLVPVEVSVAERTRRCWMLVDTGAVPSVVSRQFATLVGAAITPSRTRSIVGVGATTTEVLGEATLNVELGGQRFEVVALVADTLLFDFLLGTRGMRSASVGSIQIEVTDAGGRVRVGDGEWIMAEGWRGRALRQGPAQWSIPPSVVYAIVPSVGTYKLEMELRDEMGLSCDDVMAMIREAEEEMVGEPVAVTTGQERLVADALRSYADQRQEDTAGASWVPPNLTSSPSIVEPGPALQGVELEAYKLVRISPDLSDSATAQIRALCYEFRDVLGGADGAGCRLAPPMNRSGRAIKLTLYPNANLDSIVARCRRMAPDDVAVLEEFALRMESEGRLRREQHPLVLNQALVVDKGGGGKRVVVNFGPLNTQLLPNHYPLPRIDDALQVLAKGQFRSKFDLSKMFHQIGMSEESIPLTATRFSSSLPPMSWLVAPMGVKTVPAEAQRMMSEDFNDEQTLAYIDDVLQVTNSESEVVQATRRVLRVSREKGWTLSAKKCMIGFVELEMLGKLVGPNSIRVKPEHIEAIKNYGMPRTVRQLRRFNGMVNALTPHIPTASATMRVLHAAAGGGKQGALQWTPGMRAAFQSMIALLSSAEVVVPFDENRPLLLLTDWSTEGGAVVIAHLSTDESRFEIVEACSHSNSAAERRYGAAEGEVSMVRLALKMFPHLLLRGPVYWITDAKTMRRVFDGFRVSTNPRIVRTVSELQKVELIVIDSPGAKHRVADTLSRNPAFAVEGDASVEQQCDDDDEIVALVALALSCGDRAQVFPIRGEGAEQVESGGGDDVGAVQRQQGPNVAIPRLAMSSVFEPLDGAQRDEIESFRLRSNAELRETQEEMRVRWAARVADDADLKALRELAQRNDEIVAAGGAIPVPADSRSLEALLPRYDDHARLYVKIGDGDHWRVVVPAGCVTEVVCALHRGGLVDQAGAAHWNGRRCVAIARRWFWWRTMYADIMRWCKDCVACQRVRLLQSKEPGNIGNSEAERMPVRLSDWQLDSYTIEGEHFLTALEVYSGLALVAHVVDQTSASFVGAFESLVIQSFGVPKRVWFDGGNEMKKFFTAVCVAYGIASVEGQPYNPRSQSRVERVHRTFNAAVAKARAEGSKSTTAVLLARVAHEVNVAPSEHTDGLSPHRLMFGVEPEIPYIRFFEPKLVGLRDSSPHVPLREQVRELALAHAALAATREEDRAARRTKHETAVARTHGDALVLKEGDAVWAIIPPIGAGSKLQRHLAWSGPWEVEKFDLVTSRVDMVYRSDLDVPYRAHVHVRNTRPFSTVRPLDPPHLLDDKVFPPGWESHSVPLGGMSNLPTSVQDGLDAAIEAAAKQSALADERRRREEEREFKEKERQEALEREAVEEAARAKREAERDRKVSEAKDRKISAANEQLRIAKEQRLVVEVLEVDRGNRRVHVRRKNGEKSWLDIDDDDRALQTLIRQFDTAQRAARAARSKVQLQLDDDNGVG